MNKFETPADFFYSPKKSTLEDDVIKSLESESMIDEDQLRDMENWSYLSHRIVGAE
jgi:hypothetical protein